MIPTTLGNIIGGGLFVGVAYWYLYLTGEGDVEVDFNTGGIGLAMEAGGPMGRTSQNDKNVIEGQDPIEEKVSHLPHSGGNMTSGISRELSADKYAKRKGVESNERENGSDDTV